MNNVLQLRKHEIREAEELSLEMAGRYQSVSDPEFLLALPDYAAQLPQRARTFLRKFAMNELWGHCLIKGHRIDQERIGATPEHWYGRQQPNRELPEELLLLTYAASLGEPFGWRTQQDAKLVHDVFPIRCYEREQLGMGSKELLTWHTEDAFHPFRADYVILSCLRNPQRAATMVGGLAAAALDGDDIDVLFEERFYIKPDESHLPVNNSVTESSREMFAMIERMNTNPKPLAVLFGARQRPYLRLDPYFMHVPGSDRRATEVLDKLVQTVDHGMEEVVLNSGEIVFLNNHLAVHGRKPFAANYDGNDRWLKRANVTTDLRKSRALRESASDRIIG